MASSSGAKPVDRSVCSFHGVRQCTTTTPVSRGSQKSTAEPVGKDYPDIGDHSNVLQTPHGARDAHAPVVQETPDRRTRRRGCFVKCGQVHPRCTWASVGKRWALFCPSRADYPCFYGMRALTVGEKMTPLQQLQGPSTSQSRFSWRTTGTAPCYSKITFEPGTITASMERIPESEEDVWCGGSSTSTNAQSPADFPSMARVRSMWAPLPCAMLRPSDEKLPVSCSSPCRISCVRRGDGPVRKRF